MPLRTLSPEELPNLPLRVCPRCAGTGHDEEAARELGGHSDASVDAACDGLGVQLDVPDDLVGLTLHLAALRWVYSAEPERLGLDVDEFVQVNQALLRPLEEHGYARE